MNASVIIPTRDNAELLGATLESILADRSAVERELIVVDNGSSSSTRVAVERARAGTTAPVRYLREARVGSSHARNAGVAAASGDVLLFVDDDVLVEDGWADALCAQLADPTVGAVAGRTVPLWPAPPPAWLAGRHRERLALADFGDDDRVLADDELPVTANLAVRASLARRYEHPFEPDLGNHGARSFGWEDFHLIARIRETHRIAYAARAVARHHVRAERMSLTWMRGTFFDMGIGQLRFEAHLGGSYPSLPRRVARCARMCAHVVRTRRANDRAERVGPETYRELMAYNWTGRHVEMLFWRAPRLRDWIRGALL